MELGTEFVKLGKILADAEVSKKRPDLYNSSASTYKIKGGQDTKAIITTFHIPSAPPFGSSELRALDYYFYTDSVGIGNALAPIRLAAYKFKNKDDVSFDASKLTKNTGMVKGTTPVIVSDDVLFFTTTAMNEPLDAYTDDFNGIDNGLLGDADYTAVSRKMYVKMDPFVSAHDFLNYATQEPGTIARKATWRGPAYHNQLIKHYKMDKLVAQHGTAIERGEGEGKNVTNVIKLSSNSSNRWRTKTNKDDADWKYLDKVTAEPLLKTTMLMESDDAYMVMKSLLQTVYSPLQEVQKKYSNKMKKNKMRRPN